MKSEPEEDVVIVKDDEEEVEKREVFIYIRLSVSFISISDQFVILYFF